MKSWTTRETYDLLGYPYVGKSVIVRSFHLGYGGFAWRFGDDGLIEGRAQRIYSYECIRRSIYTVGRHHHIRARWHVSEQLQTGEVMAVHYGRLSEFFNHFEDEILERESAELYQEFVRLLRGPRM